MTLWRDDLEALKEFTRRPAIDDSLMSTANLFNEYAIARALIDIAASLRVLAGTHAAQDPDTETQGQGS